MLQVNKEPMPRAEGQGDSAEINAVFHKSRTWHPRAPSAKTGISHATCYRIITRIPKIGKPNKIGFSVN